MVPNAALLATDGATVTIKDATIILYAQGGNGVFSYGKGTTVNISDSTITHHRRTTPAASRPPAAAPPTPPT